MNFTESRKKSIDMLTEKSDIVINKWALRLLNSINSEIYNSFIDVKIYSDNEKNPIKAHKLVLSAFSPSLLNIFINSNMEDNIQLYYNLNHNVIKSAVQYIYNGTIEKKIQFSEKVCTVIITVMAIFKLYYITSIIFIFFKRIIEF